MVDVVVEPVDIVVVVVAPEELVVVAPEELVVDPADVVVVVVEVPVTVEGIVGVVTLSVSAARSEDNFPMKDSLSVILVANTPSSLFVLLELVSKLTMDASM